MTDAKSMLEILFESIWEQVKEYNYRRGEMKEQRAPGNDRCFKGVIGIQTKIKIKTEDFTGLKIAPHRHT